MEIATLPDNYSPSVNTDGDFYDSIPPNAVFATGGIRCGCGARKDKVYTSRQQFVAHTNTKTHAAWLKSLSANKTNFRDKYLEADQVVKSQKIVIAKLQREVERLKITIYTLSQEMTQLRNSDTDFPPQTAPLGEDDADFPPN